MQFSEISSAWMMVSVASRSFMASSLKNPARTLCGTVRPVVKHFPPGASPSPQLGGGPGGKCGHIPPGDALKNGSKTYYLI